MIVMGTVAIDPEPFPGPSEMAFLRGAVAILTGNPPLFERIHLVTRPLDGRFQIAGREPGRIERHTGAMGGDAGLYFADTIEPFERGAHNTRAMVAAHAGYGQAHAGNGFLVDLCGFRFARHGLSIAESGFRSCRRAMQQ
jgi:hypothetical protein